MKKTKKTKTNELKPIVKKPKETESDRAKRIEKQIKSLGKFISAPDDLHVN